MKALRYHHQLTLHGVDSRALDTIACARILRQLSPGFEAGELKPPRVGLTCSLSHAAETYQKVANGEADGKVVFVFGGGG
jgi:NADPH:quinone reductase-like Zn-dependent oxidoreductase